MFFPIIPPLITVWVISDTACITRTSNSW